jgi:hypothetical protein
VERGARVLVHLVAIHVAADVFIIIVAAEGGLCSYRVIADVTGTPSMSSCLMLSLSSLLRRWTSCAEWSVGVADEEGEEFWARRG